MTELTRGNREVIWAQSGLVSQCERRSSIWLSDKGVITHYTTISYSAAVCTVERKPATSAHHYLDNSSLLYSSHEYKLGTLVVPLVTKDL